MGFPVAAELTEDVDVVGGNLVATGDADAIKGGFGPPNNWDDITYTGAYGSLDMDTDGSWTYLADNSQSAIQDLNDGDVITEVFNVTRPTGSSKTITININGADEPPCFVVGTLIDTPKGPRPIETLKMGDLVLTQDAGPQEIRWIGSKVVTPENTENFDAVRPIRILKDCFGPGVPSHDLLVSPMHRMLLRGAQPLLMFGHEEVLCAAKLLVNGQTIVKDPAPQVEYFHMLFDRHEVILANSCPAESFLPGVVGLSNFDEESQEEVFSLFPELRSLPQSYGPSARRVLRGFEGKALRDDLRPETSFLDRLFSAA